MKSGFSIRWTDHALSERNKTFEYLEENFTQRELRSLSVEIEKVVKLIAQNPYLFPVSDINDVRKAVVLRFNSLYYRVQNDSIEVLSFFSNRQNPKSRKL